MHRPSQRNTGVVHARRITKVITKKKEKQPEEILRVSGVPIIVGIYD